MLIKSMILGLAIYGVLSLISNLLREEKQHFLVYVAAILLVLIGYTLLSAGIITLFKLG